MRPLFTIAILCSAISGAFAEPVESKGRLEALSNPNYNQSFNLQHSGISAGRSFQTDAFTGKQFYIKDGTAPKSFFSWNFWGARSAKVDAYNLPRKDPMLDSKNQIPNATKEAETKTAETKEARDSGKTVETRATADATRPYLGPERKKLDQSIDPTKPLPQTTQQGHVMNLEEIRELLNKNK